MIDTSFYTTIIRPFLFRLDPEVAHHLTHSLARKFEALAPLFSTGLTYKETDLEGSLFGTKLRNPVGLAAGFDKNGDLVNVLGHLGFGFAEVGSVTALAKDGNSKPRLFRLEQDQAIINRMGLNGEGADAIASKLQQCQFSLPLGLNIAKTNDPSITGDAAIKDILYTFMRVKDLPLTYVAINASCPNTKEGIVTEAAHMKTVFDEIQKVNSHRVPILVKLSPDSTPELVEQMVDTATGCQLSGFVCGNTSTSRDNLQTSPARLETIGAGGLSGLPLKDKALQLCRLVYAKKKDSQIIIGCGGISSGHDAYQFITAGASFIQIYTGLVYKGPRLPLLINCELSEILRKHQQTLQEAIGCAQKISTTR